MWNGSKIIVADTSCLIILGKTNELDLLKKVAEKVYITPTIHKEYGKKPPDWILISQPNNSNYEQIIEMELDKGEASAIALSLELQKPMLIIDDRKGRKIASLLFLRYSGTFGLILKAKELGIISSVKPIIDKIKATNFRFDKKLLDKVIEKAEEK